MTFALWMAVIVFVVGLDQYTKMFAVRVLKSLNTYPLWENVFHLTYVENTGAAFGMLKDARWVFMVMSSVAIIAVLVFLIVRRRHTPMLLGIALSLIAGGGIGNMIDRIFKGYVVDFFDFTLINFAVFNVADSFVCIGAGLMILYIILSEIKESKKSKTAPSDADSDAAALKSEKTE